MVKVTPKNNFVSAADLERQESLTAKLIKRFENAPDELSTNEFRPYSSFIELMNWVAYSHATGPHVTKFVHNQIIIDGQFCTFCDLNNVKITCLMKDSVVSWRTDLDFEKFFIQGTFQIKTPTFEFLHSALFHKGNQNEDEVSFFNIVPNKYIDQYIKFRNEFEDWAKLRDRSENSIHVVEGENISYEPNLKWDDLFLPPVLKAEIKQSVETILSSERFYRDSNIPWKRGIFLWGKPGLGKTTIIKTIVHNYNFKTVTVAPGTGDSALKDAFSYAEEQNPALLYFEDLDSMFQKIDISLFLNLMDGIAAKNGVFVIATANDITKFKENITDRPSRFDRKYEIPLPDKAMCLKYFKKWFGKILTSARLTELANHSVKYQFSYAYIQELYVSSVYSALAHDRKIPNAFDIKTSLAQIMSDKNIGGGKKYKGISKYIE